MPNIDVIFIMTSEPKGQAAFFALLPVYVTPSIAKQMNITDEPQYFRRKNRPKGATKKYVFWSCSCIINNNTKKCRSEKLMPSLFNTTGHYYSFKMADGRDRKLKGIKAERGSPHVGFMSRWCCMQVYIQIDF